MLQHNFTLQQILCCQLPGWQEIRILPQRAWACPLLQAARRDRDLPGSLRGTCAGGSASEVYGNPLFPGSCAKRPPLSGSRAEASYTYIPLCAPSPPPEHRHRHSHLGGQRGARTGRGRGGREMECGDSAAETVSQSKAAEGGVWWAA